MDHDQPLGRTEAAPAHVAVTGASGFVGRAILEALKQRGARILALGGPAAASDVEGIEWAPVDLLEPRAACAIFARYRPRTLIHAAWARSEGAGLWHLQANCAWRDASAALFRDFWETTGGHVVACGTCAEYNPPDDGDCVEDTTPIAPTSIYGQAKAELADRATEDAQKFGGSIAWSRLFYLYGKHESSVRLVSSVIDRLLSGEVAETSGGRAVRDFGYSRDIGEALVSLAYSGAPGTFNVATGCGVSIASLVQQIGADLGLSDRLAIGALPDRPDEPARIVADIARLRATTGWSPAYSLQQGLRETIEWRKAKKAQKA